MDLEILYIKDNGTLDKERVVLLVKEDCDLGHYILATSHMNAEGETFSSKIANTFWLPDQKVQKGDKVVTLGGIIGTIHKVVSDSEISLEIAEGVNIRVLKASVGEVLDKNSPLNKEVKAEPEVKKVTKATKKEKK